MCSPALSTYLSGCLSVYMYIHDSQESLKNKLEHYASLSQILQVIFFQKRIALLLSKLWCNINSTLLYNPQMIFKLYHILQ
jgi:hypothetical protein